MSALESQQRLEDHLLRPLVHTSRVWIGWLGFLLVLVAFGFGAYAVQVRQGLAVTLAGRDDQHMIRRIASTAPVRTPESDADILRASASCANDLIDAMGQPAGRATKALNLVVQRYARALGLTGRDIQLALFRDYQTNVELYDVWQQYFRTFQPKTLVTWGKNDPFFPAAGAEAFRRDLSHLEVHYFDTGHFALEEDAGPIAALINQYF